MLVALYFTFTLFFSPKEILNFNLKQSVPRRHQSAEVKPPSPRQACSSHHQIVIWICFWFSICKAQQKWKQILRRKCCLPSPHLFPTWMEQNLENCDNIEVLVRVTTTGMRCNQCDYDCYDASGLRAHLKELVWRSSKYSQCDFASSRAGNLRKHLKTHSGEKLNKCNKCEFASSQAGDLRRHCKDTVGKSPTDGTSHCSHIEGGPNLFFNWDLMGPNFEWNGDQMGPSTAEMGTQKSVYLKYWPKRANSLK